MCRLLPLLAAVLVAVALAGCGIRDPYADGPKTKPDPVAQANRTHELAATTTVAAAPVGGAASPSAALRAFGEQSINWTWRDLAARQRTLAAGSVDQAHDQAQLLASTATNDYEMRRGKITHRGAVESIAPKPGTPDTYLVVTLEASGTETPSYQPARQSYHVTLAAVKQTTPGRWVVSTWKPQP
ncbi:MAG: hypothetical protein JWQ48_2371 [Conexibacter sp.]|nr:hypothetical protein [Conexibacter sp.]